MQLIDYIVSLHKIYIKKEPIYAIKDRNFIQGFSQIAALLISILKTILIEFLAKNLIFIGKSSIVNGMSGSASKIDGVKFKNIVMNKFLAKSKLLVKPNSRLDFQTFKNKLILDKLKQAFIEAQIFYYLNPECYIYIKTNTLDYVINIVLN